MTFCVLRDGVYCFKSQLWVPQITYSRLVRRTPLIQVFMQGSCIDPHWHEFEWARYKKSPMRSQIFRTIRQSVANGPWWGVNSGRLFACWLESKIARAWRETFSHQSSIVTIAADDRRIRIWTREGRSDCLNSPFARRSSHFMTVDNRLGWKRCT